MSGVGIPQTGLSNVLMLARPDLAAQQQALATRRAFAESLLGQKPQYQGIGGALDTVGSRLLGALTARNANKQALDIANQERGALFGDSGSGQEAMAPQASAQPPLASLPPAAAPAPGQSSPGTPTPSAPPLASMAGGLPQGAPPAPQAQPVAQNQVQAPASAPQGGQSLFDRAVPDIPGIDPRNKFVLYASDPAGYMKAYYASQARPDSVKSALFANNGDTAAAQRDIGAQNTKAGTLEFREKGFGVLPSGKVIYGPNEESNTYFTTGPNNEPIAHPIQGGAAVAAQQAGAIEGAREGNKVIEVKLPNGKTVPMYAGAAIGAAPALANGSEPLGIRSNNPGNLQPGGQESTFANPTAGILAASTNIDNYAKNGINTLGGIISTWAPQFDKSGKQINDTPAYIADVSKRLGGVDPSKPLNLSDPNVKGAILEAMFQHENGRQPQTQNGPTQSGLPELGVSTAQEEVNKAAGEAAANSGHVQGSSDALLKAIDGMIAINDKVPDSTFLSPGTKAAINERAPGLPGFRGDAGALQQWEQMNSIGILGGIKNLGMGRTDIPIVKQVVAGGGIPANIPAADRIKLLETLRTEVLNNKAAAQNTVANLNAPNAATPPKAPMASYPTGAAHGAPSPQEIADELRRRGIIK